MFQKLTNSDKTKIDTVLKKKRALEYTLVKIAPTSKPQNKPAVLTNIY